VTNGVAHRLTTAAHCPDELTYHSPDGSKVALPYIGQWGARAYDVQLNRVAKDLPPSAQAVSGETTVSERLTRSFPTGPDMAQVCEGPKRYTVVFRPLIPGGR